MATLSFVVPLLLLVIFVRDGQSLLCWSCNSMANPDCGDPFVPDYFIVVNCDDIFHLPTNSTSRPVCMTLVREAAGNGGKYIIRSCTWVNAYDSSNKCPDFHPHDYLSCVTCDNDACNNRTAISKNVAVVVGATCWGLFMTAIMTIIINNSVQNSCF